jgi:hypothetical protein
MPPPRFAVGGLVETRWGSATVLRVYDHEHFDGRAYQLRYDWVQDTPPGFGHHWSESDMQPAGPRPTWHDEPAQAEVAPAAKAEPQLELF